MNIQLRIRSVHLLKRETFRIEIQMKFQHETVEEEDDLFHCREKLSLL